MTKELDAAPGDIRALKYRIHELEGEVIGYKRILDGQGKAEPVAIAHVGAMDHGPFEITPTAYGCDHLKHGDKLYTTPPAIAAARVQENEALRTDIAGWNSAMGEANADIEALRTANAKPRANIEKTGAMHTAVRNALMHHKLTSRPDGVIESDLIYAVLDCIKGEQG